MAQLFSHINDFSRVKQKEPLRAETAIDLIMLEERPNFLQVSAKWDGIVPRAPTIKPTTSIFERWYFSL